MVRPIPSRVSCGIIEKIILHTIYITKAAEYALAHGFDYFTTTLSVSPHKNAQVLNETGLRLEKEYGVKYLVSPFCKTDFIFNWKHVHQPGLLLNTLIILVFWCLQEA